MGNSGSMRADDGEGLLSGYAVGLRAKAADQPKVNEQACSPGESLMVTVPSLAGCWVVTV